MPLLSNQPIIYHLHLDDRRFEEFVRDLYYQDIQEKIVNNKFDDVVLLSGNKEQGRDCVLYKNGNSVGVVQCKLYDKVLTKPECAREIIIYVYTQLYMLISYLTLIRLNTTLWHQVDSITKQHHS